MSRSITLEEAKKLVELLEKDDSKSADLLFLDISHEIQSDLYKDIGKLTRELHHAITSFKIDDRLSEIAAEEIPDASERLNYVIELTEQAANKTMDAVDECIELANNITKSLIDIEPVWNKLIKRDIKREEFQDLCTKLNLFFKSTKEENIKLKSCLNNVLMAQSYQDLTGQLIKQVIYVVNEVEKNLVGMLTAFDRNVNRSKKKVQGIEATGPVVASLQSRSDVVIDQSEVDELLSNLGF